ncbi:MAG: hypothetical protein LBD99_07500 [Candidatus Margulisbacteria bacterium]|jgi:GNAT superfamily N-acetyltransferase|nr:hypothetical protein [Candidatus Margulisiibacteriota bacterium]
MQAKQIAQADLKCLTAGAEQYGLVCVKDGQERVYLVKDRSGRLAASLELGFKAAAGENPAYLKLYQISITAGFQNRGLGTALLRYFLDVAAVLDKDYLMITSTSNYGLLRLIHYNISCLAGYSRAIFLGEDWRGWSERRLIGSMRRVRAVFPDGGEAIFSRHSNVWLSRDLPRHSLKLAGDARFYLCGERGSMLRNIQVYDAGHSYAVRIPTHLAGLGG